MSSTLNLNGNGKDDNRWCLASYQLEATQWHSVAEEAGRRGVFTLYCVVQFPYPLLCSCFVLILLIVSYCTYVEKWFLILTWIFYIDWFELIRFRRLIRLIWFDWFDSIYSSINDWVSLIISNFLPHTNTSLHADDHKTHHDHETKY